MKASLSSHVTVPLMLAGAMAALGLACGARADVYLDHSGAWTNGVWLPAAPTISDSYAKIGVNYAGGDYAPTVSIGPGDVVFGSQNLLLGWDASTPVMATIAMSGGTLTAGNLVVGGNNSATGAFHQAAGAVALDGLFVGRTDGTYRLSGSGSLTTGHLWVGDGGVGRMAQDGGTVTLTADQLQIGKGGSGAYILSGGVLDAAGRTAYMGNDGAGSFQQSGGAASFDTLIVGYTTASQYTLSTGVLNVTTLNCQNGSTLRVEGGALNIGYALHVGAGNNSSVVQSGGTNTIGNDQLQIGIGGTGAYTLSGGVLEAGARTVYIGSGGAGMFQQSGGVANFGTLNLGYNTASSYALSGGEMNVVMANSANASTFAFSSGTLSADTVNFDLTNTGGTLAPGRTNTTGKTQVNGAYTNGVGATVQIQLGGTGQGMTYDWLHAGGGAALNGILTVALVDGFTPSEGDTFTVVSGSSISGTFANAPQSGNRYHVGGATFIVTYDSTTVSLSDWGPASTEGILLTIR